MWDHPEPLGPPITSSLKNCLASLQTKTPLKTPKWMDQSAVGGGTLNNIFTHRHEVRCIKRLHEQTYNEPTTGWKYTRSSSHLPRASAGSGAGTGRPLGSPARRPELRKRRGNRRGNHHGCFGFSSSRTATVLINVGWQGDGCQTHTNVTQPAG